MHNIYILYLTLLPNIKRKAFSHYQTNNETNTRLSTGANRYHFLANPIEHRRHCALPRKRTVTMRIYETPHSHSVVCLFCTPVTMNRTKCTKLGAQLRPFSFNYRENLLSCILDIQLTSASVQCFLSQAD